MTANSERAAHGRQLMLADILALRRAKRRAIKPEPASPIQKTECITAGSSAAAWLFQSARTLSATLARNIAENTDTSTDLADQIFATLVTELDLEARADAISKASDPNAWVYELRLLLELERHRRASKTT